MSEHVEDGGPAVTVKRLEWVRTPLTDSLSRAESILGPYRVWTHHEAGGVWFWNSTDFAREAPSEALAKAAAQADYESRVLSALQTSPSEPLNARTQGVEVGR